MGNDGDIAKVSHAQNSITVYGSSRQKEYYSITYFERITEFDALQH